jgi:hypothetical protein
MDAAPLHAAQVPQALEAAARALTEALAEAAQAVSGDGAAPAGTAVHALDGLGRLLQSQGLAERLLGQAQAAAPHEPSGAPLAAADPAAQAAGLQNLARPPLPTGEAAQQPQPGAEPQAPTAEGGSNDFSLPDALLVPALLVGLQVDPGVGWGLPQPQPLQERARTQETQEEHETGRQRGREDAEADGPPQEQDEADHKDTPPAPPLVFDAADARLDRLLHSLHAALCAADAPPALRAAAEQWQRGRGVVVAFPQSAPPQGAAWVYVLAPQATTGPGGATVRLGGACFEARLQWRDLPRSAHWCHVRVVKEHHPRHGRRLVAADASQDGVCAVQLGPVLAERRSPSAVTLRIAAARSFWDALGVQWSALLVVSSLALAGGAGLAGGESL